jgi:hypothetical protein
VDDVTTRSWIQLRGVISFKLLVFMYADFTLHVDHTRSLSDNSSPAPACVPGFYRFDVFVVVLLEPFHGIFQLCLSRTCLLEFQGSARARYRWTMLRNRRRLCAGATRLQDRFGLEFGATGAGAVSLGSDWHFGQMLVRQRESRVELRVELGRG